jgi:hypothetical protein
VYGPPLGFFALVFSFVIVVAIIKTVGSIAREKTKRQTNNRDDMYVDYDLRLKKLEERMANLETIVLEHERDKKFSSL